NAAAAPGWDCGRLRMFQSRPDLLIRHQFDAAVLSAALVRIVGGDEVGLAVPVRDQLVRRDSGFHEVIHHGFRTSIRQLQVVFLAADRVAVAVDVDRDVRIGLQSRCGFIQNGGITRSDLRLVEVEMHTAKHQLLLDRRRRWRWWRRWWRWRWRRRWWYRRRRHEVPGQTADQSAHHDPGGASDLISLFGTIYRGHSASEPSADKRSAGRSVLGVLSLLWRPRRARRDHQKNDRCRRTKPTLPSKH